MMGNADIIGAVSFRPAPPLRKFLDSGPFGLYIGVGILELFYGPDGNSFETGQRMQGRNTVFRCKFM